jgi:hypothetical protein
MPGPTVDTTIQRALEAYARLTEVGEAVDDEWTYIDDLTTAWRARLDQVAAARGSEPLDPAHAAAVDAASDEVARITDPHRAIDWLSTYPQVVLTALGERP